MSARDTIFQKIHSALRSLPERAPYPDYSPSLAEPSWLAAESDSEGLFRRRFTAVGGVFFDSVPACSSWLREEKVQLVYVAPGLDEIANELGKHMQITRDYRRDQVDSIDAAITLASGGIAETGTIILTDTDTPDRLAALAPWHHIAALPRPFLLRSIGEALATMPDDPNVIWVTGPSKTADVEGILIQGVHGPGQQGCLFL